MDAGLAVPPRKDAQNGFNHTQMENGQTNGLCLSEDITDQVSKQTSLHESSNGKERKANGEKEKLDGSNGRLKENLAEPTKAPRSRLDPDQLKQEEPPSKREEVCFPHTKTHHHDTIMGPRIEAFFA